MDKLLLNEKNLKLVLDNLKYGIIAHDLNRKIFFFNKEAEKITGYSKDEAIGNDCHDVFETPFCGEQCSFCSQDVTLQKSILEYAVTITTKDGETKRIEMTVSCIFDEGQLKGVIASFIDVTEQVALAAKAEELTSFSGIIGKDKAMIQLFQQIRDVASYDYPVHIHGETGTGKERVAIALHNESKRAGAPFVPVNCGAIPEGLVKVSFSDM